MAAELLIDTRVSPSGSGCVECLASGGWWFHLRRCAGCGHIGCCDSSPSQHASHHAATAGHPVVQSYEPGEDWFWDYASERYTVARRWLPPPSPARPARAGTYGSGAPRLGATVALTRWSVCKKESTSQ